MPNLRLSCVAGLIGTIIRLAAEAGTEPNATDA
jgi:hypothetical protein